MFESGYGLKLARRTLMLACVLIAGSCALWSQADAPQGPPPGPPDGMHRGHEGELRELTQALALTPEQRTQVKTLLEQRRQQVEALRTPPSGDNATPAPRPSREQMESIRQATDTKIAALLNDDQKAKFAAWQAERKQHMGHRGGPGGGPGGDGPPPPPPSEE